MDHPHSPTPLWLQRDNFDFFITIGMGVDNRFGDPANTDFVVVVNGKVCRPCARLYPLLQEVPALLPSLSAVYEGQGLAVLKRAENEGMDFAAHNITLTWLAAQARLGCVPRFQPPRTALKLQLCLLVSCSFGLLLCACTSWSLGQRDRQPGLQSQR